MCTVRLDLQEQAEKHHETEWSDSGVGVGVSLCAFLLCRAFWLLKVLLLKKLDCESTLGFAIL